MSDKLPALHFYVQDYLADTRSLTNEAKGFYVDLLCYMHKSSRRGYYQQPNGNPYSPEQMAAMTGCSADEASRLLRFLIDSEVISATHQGIPYSRRMVRDEKKRQDGIRFGKKSLKGTPPGNPGGKPKGGGGGFTEDENEDLKLGGDARGGKKKHAFVQSQFYPFENFRKSLPSWSEAKCLHFFERAAGYSKANGGRYLDWRQAVQNWDRKEPYRESPSRHDRVALPLDDFLPDALQVNATGPEYDAPEDFDD